MASPAFVAKGTQTQIISPGTASIPRPSVSTGDCLLMFVTLSFGDADVTTPSGWTLVNSVDFGSQFESALYAFRKMVTDAGTEPSTYSVTIHSQPGSNNNGSAIILSFSGVYSSVPIAASAGQRNSTNTTSSTAPSVSPASVDTLLVTAHQYGNDNTTSYSWTPPSGMTERHDGAAATGYVLGINDVPVAATGATGTKVATQSASKTSVAISIALASVAVATTPVSFAGTVPAQSATVGTAFSLALASYYSGTVTPFTYSVQAGTLPAGLTLNTSTGAISGTPTTAGTSSGIVIRATDTGSATADSNAFNIVVAAAPVGPTITGPGGATGSTSVKSQVEGSTAVHTFTADQSVTWSLNGGADVSKFAINSGTGVLTFLAAPVFGSPTDVGADNTYVVGVRATNGSSQATTQTLTVTITATPVLYGFKFSSQSGLDFGAIVGALTGAATEPNGNQWSLWVYPENGATSIASGGPYTIASGRLPDFSHASLANAVYFVRFRRASDGAWAGALLQSVVMP